MPLKVYRYKNRTVKPSRYRKRRYRKRKSGFARKSLLGNKLAIKFKYVDRISLNPGATGATAVNVFSANGLFDPDITGVGHQPRGFDEIMPLYQHYTVISAKITVSGKGMDSTSGTIGVQLSDATTVQTGQGYLESRNRAWRSTSINSDTTTVSKTFSAKKFLGRPHPLSEDDLRGTDAANPTEGAFFHVFYQVNDTAVDATLSTFRVMIEYNAILTEPVNPAVS